MKRTILAAFFSAFTGPALAACTGAAGVPFNCAAGTTPALADVVLAGSNSGAQAGITVAYTLSQIIELAFTSSSTVPVEGTLFFDGTGNGGTQLTGPGAGLSGNVYFVIGGNAGAGTNLNGGPVLIIPGYSTGNGTGVVKFYASGGGSSGTTVQNAAPVMTVEYNQEIMGEPVVLPHYSVAGLPACNSGIQYSMAVATDATAPTYNAALVGSGTSIVPVFCDGTSWKSH